MIPLINRHSREKRRVIHNSKGIIRHLAVDIGERTIRKYENLERTRRFIIGYFTRYGVVPREEAYVAAGHSVANVIAEIRGSVSPEKIVLVGAHYDTIEDTPGADDNASGIAALLEMFRILSGGRYRKTARFVAFTLEEPPFFSTELMGSMVHAKNSRKRRDKIELMVCLEMMGFGSRRCHQDYPVNHRRDEFPSYGSYMSVISLPSNSIPVLRWKELYNSHARKKIYEYIGPASIPGMDLSDHMSFIRSGYPAIMLSDTGFYRNKHYHCPDDTYETINFRFLSESIIDSSRVLQELLDRDD